MKAIKNTALAALSSVTTFDICNVEPIAKFKKALNTIYEKPRQPYMKKAVALNI